VFYKGLVRLMPYIPGTYNRVHRTCVALPKALNIASSLARLGSGLARRGSTPERLKARRLHSRGAESEVSTMD
jgi:hypothetical protein